MSRLVWPALALLFGLALLTPFAGLPALASADPRLAATILIELRLPRALCGLAYGALLGGAGAAVQALFANPLASPDITGASGGAALGAVVTAYLLGATAPLLLALGGACGALAALALLLALAGPRAPTATLLLAGVAVASVTGAATALALALAPSPFAFYDAYGWLMGSLVDRSLVQAAIVAAPATIALGLLARDAGALDALALGDDAAASIGHDLTALRRRVILTVAVALGAAVSVCGAVGFIGLVAPVLARRMTDGHPGRAIVPAAAIGAALLLAADTLVRLAPAGRPLPVGVLTALFGAPFFLALIVRLRLSWRG